MKNIITSITLSFLLTTACYATTPPKMVRISLSTSNNAVSISINDRSVNHDKLIDLLGKVAHLDTSQQILISVDATNSIADLIQLRRECQKIGFSNIISYIKTDEGYISIMLGEKAHENPIEDIWNEAADGL